ncbi:uncharacterized protein [Aristolochia californica]
MEAEDDKEQTGSSAPAKGCKDGYKEQTESSAPAKGCKDDSNSGDGRRLKASKRRKKKSFTKSDESSKKVEEKISGSENGKVEVQILPESSGEKISGSKNGKVEVQILPESSGEKISGSKNGKVEVQILPESSGEKISGSKNEKVEVQILPESSGEKISGSKNGKVEVQILPESSGEKISGSKNGKVEVQILPESSGEKISGSKNGKVEVQILPESSGEKISGSKNGKVEVQILPESSGEKISGSKNGKVEVQILPESSGEFRNSLVWIDLEMTGLDVEVDRILEIACIVTDGKLSKVVEGPDLVIHQSKECLENMGEWCQSHHATSGLTERVLQSTVTEKEAEKEVMEFVKKHVGTDRKALLAGNSVYVDFQFLKKYMPDLAGLFSHVVVDVSSVKALCIRWFPGDHKRAPQKANKHRAMDDIKESIAELRYYKQAIFKATRSGR